MGSWRGVIQPRAGMEIKPLNLTQTNFTKPASAAGNSHHPTSSATPREEQLFVQLTPSSGDDPAKGTLLPRVGQKKHSTSQVKNKEHFQIA